MDANIFTQLLETCGVTGVLVLMLFFATKAIYGINAYNKSLIEKNQKTLKDVIDSNNDQVDKIAKSLSEELEKARNLNNEDRKAYERVLKKIDKK